MEFIRDCWLEHHRSGPNVIVLRSMTPDHKSSLQVTVQFSEVRMCQTDKEIWLLIEWNYRLIEDKLSLGIRVSKERSMPQRGQIPNKDSVAQHRENNTTYVSREKLRTKAHRRAVKILIDKHRPEWEEIYKGELEREGIGVKR